MCTHCTELAVRDLPQKLPEEEFRSLAAQCALLPPFAHEKSRLLYQYSQDHQSICYYYLSPTRDRGGFNGKWWKQPAYTGYSQPMYTTRCWKNFVAIKTRKAFKTSKGGLTEENLLKLTRAQGPRQDQDALDVVRVEKEAARKKADNMCICGHDLKRIFILPEELQELTRLRCACTICQSSLSYFPTKTHPLSKGFPADKDMRQATVQERVASRKALGCTTPFRTICKEKKWDELVKTDHAEVLLQVKA